MRFITSLSEMEYFGAFLFVVGIDMMFVMKQNGLYIISLVHILLHVVMGAPSIHSFGTITMGLN